MAVLRKRSFERRLFGWLLVLSVLPALLVLAGSLAVGARTLGLIGTLGPWERVADSGRALIDAAESSPSDSVLTAAAERHREELSNSLVQANRWSFLEERLVAAAPLLAGIAILVLVLAALVVSRMLAREMASPINDLVAWAGRLGRGESLPPQNGHGRFREPAEIEVLRGALRHASNEIETARRLDLEAERTRAWGEMARRVAHEMKNPLTPLKLAAHRISRQAPDDPALLDAAMVIREETERLDELARGFAALGRPAPGPATEVDLRELLASLLETDVPEPVRHTIVVAEGTCSVHGHYDALQRAFRNLIRNAVEAVQEGGGTGIEVGIEEEGDLLRVAIRDDGPGIPPDLTEAIFEPDRTLKARGTGLGLAIVRQVAAAHGGNAAGRNRDDGRGAEFIVRLRKQPRGAAMPQP
jgi:nitrogen fixation/metabolism regulation signal transduction histidine kinase